MATRFECVIGLNGKSASLEEQSGEPSKAVRNPPNPKDNPCDSFGIL